MHGLDLKASFYNLFCPSSIIRYTPFLSKYLLQSKGHKCCRYHILHAFSKFWYYQMLHLPTGSYNYYLQNCCYDLDSEERHRGESEASGFKPATWLNNQISSLLWLLPSSVQVLLVISSNLSIFSNVLFWKFCFIMSLPVFSFK